MTPKSSPSPYSDRDLRNLREGGLRFIDPRVRTWEAGKADIEAVKRAVLESRKAQQRKIALDVPASSTLGSLVVEEGGCTPAGDGECRLQLPT